MTGIHRNLSSVPGVGRRGQWSFPRGAVALREQWRAEAARSGWSRPRDWWTPEVDALADALCCRAGATGTGAVPACARLGTARAEAGVGLTEALDDLCAVFRVLPAGSPPLPGLRAFVEAWADVWLRGVSAVGCVDPLTQLASPEYLRTRLAELYRAAEVAHRRVPDQRALLVVAFDNHEHGWRHLSRQLAVAESLRGTFPGGETLAALSAHRTVAVVERAPAVVAALTGLRARLSDQLGAGTPRTWLCRLPDRVTGVAALIAELTHE